MATTSFVDAIKHKSELNGALIIMIAEALDAMSSTSSQQSELIDELQQQLATIQSAFSEYVSTHP